MKKYVIEKEVLETFFARILCYISSHPQKPTMVVVSDLESIRTLSLL